MFPPQSEWDRHKAEILTLVAEKTLKDAIGTMRERGFIATPSQYEAQLKRWGLCKNLKQQEWRAVLGRYDFLVGRHQEVRLLIHGRVITHDKIQKHRRRYCHGPSYLAPSGVRPVVPECVSFETLDADHQWTLCTNGDGHQTLHDPPVPDNSAEMMVSAVARKPSPSAPLHIGSHTNQQESEANPSSLGEGMNTHQSHLLEDDQLDPDVNETDVKQMLPDSSVLPGIHSMFPLVTPWTALPPGQAEDFVFDPILWPVMSPAGFSQLTSRPTPFELLQDLSFRRFERALKANGINLEDHLSKASAYFQVHRVHNPVTMFIVDAAEAQSSESTVRSSHIFAQHFNAKLLPSLETLLPGEALQEEQRKDQGLFSRNGQFEANFLRLLTFSTVNGFAGMESIPIAAVLKFLAHYGNVGDLLMRILKASPHHVAKALAENIFKAAIEAQEENIVKMLLSTQLVDVNKTVCDVAGEKFTAIERAAALQNTAMVITLLDSGADVNKTFAIQPGDFGRFDGGALERLIRGLARGATITQSVTNLARLLLEASAVIGLYTLESLFTKFHDEELVYLLVATAAESDHARLISRGFLYLLAKQLDHEKASNATSSILQVCENRHHGLCLKSSVEALDKALFQGAINGNVQFVRSMLPYTNVDSLDGVLSASIRSRNRELIDFILTQNPNTNAATPPNGSEETRRESSMMTPLSEAIRTGDVELIRFCEDSGALKHLQGGRRFEAAITAAATVGNLEYVQKLFHHHPSPDPEDMLYALFYSIENGYEEISWFLLDAGANVNPTRQQGSAPNPLFAAVLRRNGRLVREILEADVHAGTGIHAVRDSGGHSHHRTVFDEAIRWGDRSIILDLKSALTHPAFRPDTFKETLEAANDGLFGFLIEQGLVGKSDLTRCLEVAIKRGDAKMLYFLTELGADPLDPNVLAFAARFRAEMLPLLLEYIRRPIRGVRCRFGVLALQVAIERGLAGLEAVNILLSSKAIDINARESIKRYYRSYTSPLGLAIKESKVNSHGDFAIVRSLLKAGCNPNATVIFDEYAKLQKQTALLAAIQTSSMDLVELLADHNADINTTPAFGVRRSPLQLAAELGYLGIVKLLLNGGADPNTPPAIRDGGTALQCAAMSGACNIAAELLSRGANLHAPPSKVNGRWPLEGAAEYGRLDMIEYLWKASVTGVDDEQCKRAMMLAEANGFLGCRDLIMELSASRGLLSHPLLSTDFTNM